MSYQSPDIIEASSSQEQPSEILSFFLPSAADAAIRESGFTVGEELQMIIDTVRDAMDSPNIHMRLAALKYWAHRAKEIAEAGGLIQKVTAQLGPENQRTLMAQTSRLLEVGQTNTNIGVPNGSQDDQDRTDGEDPPHILEVEVRPTGGSGSGPGSPAEGGPGDPATSGDPAAAPELDSEPVTVDGDAGGFTRTGHFPPKTSKGGLSGR